MYRVGQDGKLSHINYEVVDTISKLNCSDDETMCINGTFYKKDKRGFIPELVDEFVAERVNVKKRMIELKKANDKSGEIEHLDNYQKAIKVLNNGLYGSLGQKHFRWFDLDLAEAVTATGQYCTRYVEKQINEYLNKLLKTENYDYVIAADTDSVYLNLEELVNKCGLSSESTEHVVEFLDRACKEKLQPLIERYCLDVCSLLNVFKQTLVMKRDIIADKAIWRKSKMYIANVWNAEGVAYKEP